MVMTEQLYLSHAHNDLKMGVTNQIIFSPSLGLNPKSVQYCSETPTDSQRTSNNIREKRLFHCCATIH